MRLEYKLYNMIFKKIEDFLKTAMYNHFGERRKCEFNEKMEKTDYWLEIYSNF